jgi:hypothetical protein
MIEVVVSTLQSYCCLSIDHRPAFLSHAHRRDHCPCRRGQSPSCGCDNNGRVLSQLDSDWCVQLLLVCLVHSRGCRPDVFAPGRVPAGCNYRILPSTHSSRVHRRRRHIPHRNRASHLALSHSRSNTPLRFEVAAGINDEGGFQYNLDTFKLYFMNKRNLTLWVPAFALAVLLRIITHKVHHQLVFPMCRSCLFECSSVRLIGW